MTQQCKRCIIVSPVANLLNIIFGIIRLKFVSSNPTFPAVMLAVNVQNLKMRNIHTGPLLCSNKSLCLLLLLRCAKCDIGCDTSISLTAGQRPASIQPHHNMSILQRDILPTFCAQRSRLSLRCGPL